MSGRPSSNAALRQSLSTVRSLSLSVLQGICARLRLSMGLRKDGLCYLCTRGSMAAETARPMTPMGICMSTSSCAERKDPRRIQTECALCVSDVSRHVAFYSDERYLMNAHGRLAEGSEMVTRCMERFLSLFERVDKAGCGRQVLARPWLIYEQPLAPSRVPRDGGVELGGWRASFKRED